MDRGDHNEEVGVGFVGFGQTSEITSRSLAEIKTEKEKNYLTNVRYRSIRDENRSLRRSKQ